MSNIVRKDQTTENAHTSSYTRRKQCVVTNINETKYQNATNGIQAKGIEDNECRESERESRGVERVSKIT